MKADPEVKMISAEAPILFAKGCDIFITELTMRAWIHAEENKRRTLQRSDIASALAKSDMFDFLIDIVPREEAAAQAKRTASQAGAPTSALPASGQPRMSGQHTGISAASNHSIGGAEYLGGHTMAHDQDYRQNPSMYPAPVAATSGTGYAQNQAPGAMYGEMGDMYSYSTMQSQQVTLRR